MDDLMTIPELESELRASGTLSKLNSGLIDRVAEFGQEIYPNSFHYGFKVEQVRFQRSRLPYLNFALNHDLVDSFFVKGYPTDRVSDQPILLFWIDQLLKSGMNFYDIERHRNACTDYHFLLNEPLWRRFEANATELNADWTQGWRTVYESLTHPTLREAVSIQPNPRIIFVSSQNDIELSNPMLIEREGSPAISERFDSYSADAREKLTFRNIMERHGEIIGPEEWLLCAALPPFRFSGTSKLSAETWELVSGMTPTHAVGGNCNIEGIYLGPHGTNEALSYGRVRSAV